MTAIDRRHVLMMLVSMALPKAAGADVLPLIELPGEVPAPDFSLPDLHGKIHRLSDYRGRPVLVNFWAVWCPPCRREMTELADLHRRLADSGIAIFAINLGDSATRVTDFLTEHPAPRLSVLLDVDKSAAAPWHIMGLPAAYVVAPDGVLRLGAIGKRDWRAPAIERQLRSLL